MQDLDLRMHRLLKVFEHFILNVLWLMPVLLAEAQDIHYVKTTDSPSSDCPHQPCFTLHQYTQTNNFTTGTTLQFLPGNHTLQKSMLNLTSVSNITLRGKERVNIISTNVSIYFENVRGLNVEGLTFLLNNVNVGTTALKVINCSDVLISNTSFQGRNITNLAPDSADIHVSWVRAILLKQSVVTIQNCVFVRIKGGVIYVSDDTHLTVCMSYFTGNKGNGDGSAIHAHASTLLLDGSITPNHFAFNSDEFDGGALQCNHCKLEMRGVNIFQNNFLPYSWNINLHQSRKGGALYVTDGRVTVHGNVCYFNNTATAGGAVYVENSLVSIEGDIVFEGNVAKYSGGGMCVMWTYFAVPGHLKFVNNIAGKSAGLHIDTDYIRSSQRRSKIILSASLTNNTGTGAVDINSANVVFMDISVTGNSNVGLVAANSNIIFCGRALIVGNAGGGMRAENSEITFENETLFDSNRSPNGGALNCQEGMISLKGTSLFLCNTADGDGGAIYAVGTSVHMQGTVNFTRNTASNGGAIYLDAGASLILQTSDSWTQETYIYSSYNLALKYGGGIYHTDSPTIRQCFRGLGFSLFVKLPYCFLQGEPYDFLSRDTVLIHS